MNKLDQFIIDINDLDEGTYDFNFIVEDWFFENFEFSEIKKGRFDIALTLTKQLDLILLNFVFNGFALVCCDRCGEEFQQPLSGNNELIVKRGDNFIDEDDIITIPFNDKSLNLSQYFYEYLNLLLPMKNIHPLDKNNKSTCNIENLKLLEHYTSDKKNNNDSPWSILNQLKNKL